MNEIKLEQDIEEQRQHEAVLKKLIQNEASPFYEGENSPLPFEDFSEQEKVSLATKHGIVEKLINQNER